MGVEDLLEAFLPLIWDDGQGCGYIFTRLDGGSQFLRLRTVIAGRTAVRSTKTSESKDHTCASEQRRLSLLYGDVIAHQMMLYWRYRAFQ